MKNNVVEKIEHNKCVGCKACESICPTKSISFCEDEEGFEYPSVEDEKCINCGKCINVCPVNVQPQKDDEEKPRCFSAWSKIDAVRDKSTSGGFFYELAKIILENGGIVIGAKYSEDFKHVYHAAATNCEELGSLMGSKYVQSDTSGVFQLIKGGLDKKRKVLFAGTPCQCAAVRRFFDSDVMRDNLYLMDFVCYSIYSPLVYRKWLEELEEQEKSKVIRLRFKSKKFGWENRYVEIEFENETVKYQSDLKGEDLYIAGIEDSDLYQRYSCYECQFRKEVHQNADFTVGDFWGIKSQTSYDMFKGISFVIVHEAKALEMIRQLSRSMVIRSCNISDIRSGNPNMIANPVLQFEKRKKFFSLLEIDSFSKALFKIITKKKTKFTLNYKEFKRILFDKNISAVKYIYYNYFCKNVIRKEKAKIIPYKNAIISFGKNSKLILEGYKNFSIGINKLSGSKAETYLRLSRDARMTLKHGGDLYYGTTMEVLDNAEFESGYFSANTGTVIVVDYKMVFGEYVGFGRNNLVYDSDFHAMHTSSGAVINKPCKTTIGNHVWITSNNTILPGSDIGDNVVVGNGNSVNYRVPSDSFIRNNEVRPFSGWWSERSNNKGETLSLNKKIVIVGFGAEGKIFYSKIKNPVVAIIDNNSKDERVVTFEKFAKENGFVDLDIVFVICSSKYFDVLYEMVRSKFPNALILANSQFV